MKTFIILAVLFCVCNSSKSQSKKIIQKDVDILYNKYKNSDSVTVKNSSVELLLLVDKNVNSSALPVNVILSGYVGTFENKVAVSDILDNLMEAKKKAGYKFMGNNIIYFKNEKIKVSVYQKGTQYAKYGFTDDDDHNFFSYEPNEEIRKKNEEREKIKILKGAFVYMEVGDFARKEAKTLEKFTF